MRRTLNDSFLILESESILAANSSGVRTTILHDLRPDSLVTRYDSAAGPPRELGIGLFLKKSLCGWMPVRIQSTYIQPPPLILFLLISPTSAAKTGNNQGHMSARLMARMCFCEVGMSLVIEPQKADS